MFKSAYYKAIHTIRKMKMVVHSWQIMRIICRH